MIDGSCTLISVVRDITQRKRLEEELRRMNLGLEEEVRVRTEQLTATIDRLHDEVARRVLAEGRLHTPPRCWKAFSSIPSLPWRSSTGSSTSCGSTRRMPTGRQGPRVFRRQEPFRPLSRRGEPGDFRGGRAEQEAVSRLRQAVQLCQDSSRGITYWNWQITPLLDEHGQVQSLVFNLEDVTEQQKGCSRFRERARQLQKLTLELSEAEDRERKRLAEILHDDLQQMLGAAKFHVGLLVNHDKHGEDVQKMAQQVKDMLAQAIDKSRSLSQELSPPVLGQSDLCETFEWLAEHIRTTHGLTVNVEVCDPVEVQSEPLKAFLFKAAQELLFNVIKHARVKEARLRLRRRRGYIYLSVADQGQGFDPQSLGKNGFGLLSIQERVALLGGHMKIRSSPGRGSIFLIKISDPAARMTVETPWVGTPWAAKTAARRRRAEREGQAGLRILLVDNHKIVREDLEAMLIEEKDIEVVGQAATAGKRWSGAQAGARRDRDGRLHAGDDRRRGHPADQAGLAAHPDHRAIHVRRHEDRRPDAKGRGRRLPAQDAASEQLLAAIRGSESPSLAAGRS